MKHARSWLKRAAVALICVVLTTWSGTQIGLATNVDQSHSPPADPGGDDICDMSGALAQTFTSGVDSHLAAVNVRLTRWGFESGGAPVTAQIRTVVSGVPTHTVLGSGSITIPENFQGWVEVPIGWVAITKGQMYAVVLTRTDCRKIDAQHYLAGDLQWDIVYDSPSPYTGGAAWIPDGDTFWPWPLEPDYVFRTFVASTNANLYRLIVAGGNDQTILYGLQSQQTTTVPNQVDKVTLTPELANGLSQVSINGTPVENKSHFDVPVAVGDNVIIIDVTSENGGHQIYRITVRRAPGSSADLRGIVVQGHHLLGFFTPNITEYTLSVDNDVKEITLGAVAAHLSATVSINGTATNVGGTFTTVSLVPGANTVHFDVTAQDGVTHKQYTLTVTRAASTDSEHTH